VVGGPPFPSLFATSCDKQIKKARTKKTTVGIFFPTGCFTGIPIAVFAFLSLLSAASRVLLSALVVKGLQQCIAFVCFCDGTATS
jgi:hypothetical protein